MCDDSCRRSDLTFRGMVEEHDPRSSAYITQTLQRALEAAFAPRSEKEKETALAVVGAVLKRAMTEDALAVVMAALHTNITQDFVVANVLYEIHANCGTDDLRPASLIRLARRAYEARSLETLASTISILANRPSTLVDVERDWLAAALGADLEAGHCCRAATIADILAAWPSRAKLASIQKVRCSVCECGASAEAPLAQQQADGSDTSNGGAPDVPPRGQETANTRSAVADAPWLQILATAYGTYVGHRTRRSVGAPTDFARFVLGTEEAGAVISATPSENHGWILGVSARRPGSSIPWVVEVAQRDGDLCVSVRCPESTALEWSVRAPAEYAPADASEAVPKGQPVQ
jgi:hypothetical protein